MVTIQDIGLQLTKPVKELAEWNFPFSQTLEKYCSLFNTTCNKSFGEAGLVLQSSTAVYVHRVDSLWNKIEYFKDIFSTYEHEDVTKNATKKKDRRSDMRFQEFKTIDFAAEVEKNIDIKKTHAMHETVKSKSRRFTQLEKGIAQHISIDIYDINGEVIGKKYDFRCNQNISIDGILVDEFAPQDFCCHDDTTQKSPSNSNHSCVSESLESSSNILLTNSTVHDDHDENNDDPSEDNSELVSSFDLNQEDLFLSRNTDNTLTETSIDISSDCLNGNLTLNEKCLNTPSTTNSPTVTTIDNVISPNGKNADAIYINNNIKENLDVCTLLDSPPESIHSKERRTSSTDDSNEDRSNAKLDTDTLQRTPSSRNAKNKTRVRSTVKSTPKSFKRKLAPCKRRRNMTKKILAHLFENSNSTHTDGPNMFKQNLSTCLEYIRKYDPLRYEDVTDVTLDLLGFQLRVNTESDDSRNQTTNANDNVTTTSNDNDISKLYSPEPVDMSFLHQENFCDTWFQSNSSDFSPKNVDRWHELMQPKLREAEQRSMFCIHDYASRIIKTLKTSGQRKINFDTVIQTERACEVARYFLASLDLASRQSVDISADKNFEHNIEIRLPEEDGQCSSNDQADSCD